MGFLHKLWDETLAGPAPESGLSKLRKYDSFSASRSSPMIDAPVNITRSITIIRNNNNNYSNNGSISPRLFRNLSVDTSGSAPGSPLGSSTPGTPVSPMTPPPGDFKKFKRRKATKDFELPERVDRRGPTVHDWIVINALDH